MLKQSYLRNLYKFNYTCISKYIPKTSGATLEIGSGGGFFKQIHKKVVTSDIIKLPFVCKKINGNKIPFKNQTVKAIVGLNVLHHISNIDLFFQEADRTLKLKGRLIFIEPWPTPLSFLIYKCFHHEPFEMWRDWSIRSGTYLNSANGALPWIVFHRDKKIFYNKFPHFKILKVKTFMPFSYLLSGGIERRWELPSWLFRVIRFLERPFDFLGLFALIVVEKTKK